VSDNAFAKAVVELDLLEKALLRQIEGCSK
jgi:hypothetical protein